MSTKRSQEFRTAHLQRLSGANKPAATAPVKKPMDDFSAGGGNAKMKETGMSRDQVVALGKKNLTNSYDLYDIILSHLLDEGYAETQEQAEAIMVNMSEEWRESIVEKRESDEPGERDDRPDVKAHNNAVKYRPRSRKPRIEDDPRFGTPRDEGGNWKY